MTRRIRNWDRTLSWRPVSIHRPRDAAEVAAIVAKAAAAEGRVKAIGSALSWSDAADIRESVIVFDRMTDISVDVDAKRVTVQAGAKLSDVNDALAEHGLAFENFGSITMQTAGGYTGTGTHGTGGRIPILSSYIEAIQLVDGEGGVHEVTRDCEPELFSAARVHLGCLGVITEITFRCVEAFNLEEHLAVVPFDEALEKLDDYVDGNAYCKLWWLPYNRRIQVYTFNKTDKPRSRTTFQGLLDSSGLSGLLFGGLLKVTRLLPGLIPQLLEGVQRVSFQPHTRVDRSDRIIRYAGSIPWHQETEYAIPRQHAAEAIGRMRDMVLAADDYRVNFPQEIRFVAADDIPMSCANDRDCCYLGGYVSGLKWARAYHRAFEALMRDYDGRPHWGKSFDRTHDELRALYPRYDDFAALRERCDPFGVFRNSFVDRVFPENGSA